MALGSPFLLLCSQKLEEQGELSFLKNWTVRGSNMAKNLLLCVLFEEAGTWLDFTWHCIFIASLFKAWERHVCWITYAWLDLSLMYSSMLHSQRWACFKAEPAAVLKRSEQRLPPSKGHFIGVEIISKHIYCHKLPSQTWVLDIHGGEWQLGSGQHVREQYVCRNTAKSLWVWQKYRVLKPS